MITCPKNLSWKKKILAAVVIVLVVGAAITPVRVAVVGHTQDIISRVTHEDMVIGGANLKTGMIDVDADGQDAAHYASGTITLVDIDGKRYIQLGEDFTTGLAPDLHIYVSATKDINNEVDFNSSDQLNLGKLTSNAGASFYEVPLGTDVQSVTIWCKQFGAYMGSADL